MTLSPLTIGNRGLPVDFVQTRCHICHGRFRLHLYFRLLDGNPAYDGTVTGASPNIHMLVWFPVCCIASFSKAAGTVTVFAFALPFCFAFPFFPSAFPFSSVALCLSTLLERTYVLLILAPIPIVPRKDFTPELQGSQTLLYCNHGSWGS